MGEDAFVTRHPALLGFEEKAVSLVEVDPPRADRAVPRRILDRPFEGVVIRFMRCICDSRMRDAEHIAEFQQKHATVGTLLPALAPLPSLDKLLDCRFHANGPPRHLF